MFQSQKVAHLVPIVNAHLFLNTDCRILLLINITQHNRNMTSCKIIKLAEICFPGKEVSLFQLAEAAMHSKVLEMNDDYIEPNFREWCESVIPDLASIEGKYGATKFLHLKEQFMQAFTSRQ